MMTVTGAKELTAALERLGDPKAVKRVTKSAVGKGLRVLAKTVKAQIPPKFKEAKKGIGSRFGKPKTRNNVEARIGVGVGISKKRLAKFKKKDRTGRSGVGASANNLHWFILGTEERQQKSGHGTGAMPPQPEVASIIADGMKAGESAAMAKIADGIREGIVREVAKAKR